MLKQIKNKTKKQNSMLDFVLELNQKYNLKNVKLDDKVEQKKLEREKRKYCREKKMLVDIFNGHINTRSETQIIKNFKEDQENNSDIINLMSSKKSFSNKTITDFFYKKNPAPALELRHFDKQLNYLNVNQEILKNYVLNKGKFIEFYDELNKRNIRKWLYDEKSLKFCKSKILPQIKVMKIDNDVLTDDEQIKDAAIMLSDNLKETIKLIDLEGKDFLQNNLSRKLLCKKKST